MFAAAGILIAGASTGVASASTPHSSGLAKTVNMHAQRVCAQPTSPGVAACLSQVMVPNKGGTPSASGPPASGLTPAQLRNAYNLNGTSSGGRTVAIVDAYGYPNLERDLGVYRSQFGIPACTRANGCLRVINQTGGSTLPSFNVGWAGETALDVDAVSATCPDCKILVVEANSASVANLGTAANTAAQQAGVVAISNSYGAGDLNDASYGAYYRHPGIAVTASTGDNGYKGASFPASSAYVTAVGGTSLATASNARGWNETAWSGAGSGCSAYNAALAAAAPFNTGCAKRASSDVSAAANPGAGGLAIYWPTSSRSSSWAQVGGTSESSPIIASVYALSGNTAGTANAIPYANPSALWDITSGSTGSCPTTQWCNAGTGWDGPTGLGTPNGVGAF